MQIPIPPKNKTVLAPLLGHEPDTDVPQHSYPIGKADPNKRSPMPVEKKGFLDKLTLSYEVSKTIRKNVDQEEVFGILADKLRSAGRAYRNDEALVISGFNNTISGRNYIATCRFSLYQREAKTIIRAKIRQRPTGFFVVFSILALFTTIFFVLPIILFHLGKVYVTKTVQTTLDEIAEELE